MCEWIIFWVRFCVSFCSMAMTAVRWAASRSLHLSCSTEPIEVIPIWVTVQQNYKDRIHHWDPPVHFVTFQLLIACAPTQNFATINTFHEILVPHSKLKCSMRKMTFPPLKNDHFLLGKRSPLSTVFEFHQKQARQDEAQFGHPGLRSFSSGSKVTVGSKGEWVGEQRGGGLTLCLGVFVCKQYCCAYWKEQEDGSPVKTEQKEKYRPYSWKMWPSSKQAWGQMMKSCLSLAADLADTAAERGSKSPVWLSQPESKENPDGKWLETNEFLTRQTKPACIKDLSSQQYGLQVDIYYTVGQSCVYRIRH